jgi:hypothetical protein
MAVPIGANVNQHHRIAHGGLIAFQADAADLHRGSRLIVARCDLFDGQSTGRSVVPRLKGR